MGSRMNYEKIAELEGIDVELIRGKNWSEIRAIIAAVRDKADGGRVGFVEGGWADDLTGQGLALYNSMTAGGHSTQTIQDTLKQLGYWGGDATVDTGVQSIVNTQPSMGGDGGSGLTAINPVQYGQYGAPGYTGGLSGDVQQSGTGRVFTDPSASPIGESYSYRKEVPGWARMAAGFIPFGTTALNFIEKRMNPEGPLTSEDVNKSRYAMGGLDALDKKAYNELAGSGMLFDGSSGVKTLTGKNFGAKGYFEGQKEMYDNLTEKGFSMNDMGQVTDEDGNVIGGIDKKGNVFGNFKAKQYLEASKMFDFKQQKDEKASIDLQKEIDAENASLANIGKIEQYTGKPISDYRESRPESERQFTGHGKSGMGRDPDDKMASGGRVGLRYGGLLSIL